MIVTVNDARADYFNARCDGGHGFVGTVRNRF